MRAIGASSVLPAWNIRLAFNSATRGAVQNAQGLTGGVELVVNHASAAGKLDFFPPPDPWQWLTFLGAWIAGLNFTDWAGFHTNAYAETIFLPPAQRPSYDAGRTRFLPMSYSQAWQWMATTPLHGAVVLVFELLQAAQAAAIAQRLPLVLIELGEGFTFPEGFDFGGHGEGTVRGEKAGSLAAGATTAKGGEPNG